MWEVHLLSFIIEFEAIYDDLASAEKRKVLEILQAIPSDAEASYDKFFWNLQNMMKTVH